MIDDLNRRKTEVLSSTTYNTMEEQCEDRRYEEYHDVNMEMRRDEVVKPHPTINKIFYFSGFWLHEYQDNQLIRCVPLYGLIL